MPGRGTVETPSCSCCGRTVRQTVGVVCRTCARAYHKKCFLRDSGVDPTTARRCICCLCPVLPRKVPSEVVQKSNYARSFLDKGFCVIPLPKEIDGELVVDLLQRWNVEANKIFSGFAHTYECLLMNGRSGTPSLDGGYSNFRRRCEGRFEMISDAITASAVPLLENCDDVKRTLDVLLSPQRKQMTSGCFYSVHGSKIQNYHTDGPPLSDVVDLYPYAVNVFIPLVPVNNRNGTEFVPGTQRVGNTLDEAEWRKRSERPSVPVGSVLLFDYRVVHRGLPNVTTTPRPCYYVTYSRSWYTDKYNFSEQRYKRRLEVNPAFTETREERSRRRTEMKGQLV